MNKEITLVIMAAGIGSRFGKKIKQLEPIGPDGELLMDYSVYDAVKAGFNHIVFIIRRDIEELFHKAIGDRLSEQVKVTYVFQEKEDIPIKKELSSLRIKPWGTGQAVLAAKNAVKGAFAVINADDFYGYDAFKTIADYLRTADNEGKTTPEYAMCGFRIGNTLSENGTVTRGICTVKDGFLAGLEETKNISRKNGIISGTYNGKDVTVAENAAASMNMWAFTADFMGILEESFVRYLSPLTEETVNEGEFLVPISVDRLISAGICSVRVLPTDSKWFGMTYEEDVALVKESIKESIAKGDYPEKLWK